MFSTLLICLSLLFIQPPTQTPAQDKKDQDKVQQSQPQVQVIPAPPRTFNLPPIQLQPQVVRGSTRGAPCPNCNPGYTGVRFTERIINANVDVPIRLLVPEITVRLNPSVDAPSTHCYHPTSFRYAPERSRSGGCGLLEYLRERRDSRDSRSNRGGCN